MFNIIKAKHLAAFIVGIFIAVNGYSQTFLTNGLVAYFPFNGTAIDASGNGHNGTVNGTVLNVDRFGKPNAAYHFTGGQYIDIPLDCSSQKPLTYSFWINQDQEVQSVGQAFIWTGTFDAPSHNVGVGLTNLMYVEFYPRGMYRTGFYVSPHSWQHIVVTYSDSVMVFVNGSKIGEVPYPSAPGFRSAITRLGRYQDFYVGAFEGVMDDVRIYNRALAENEVAQLFALESAPIVNIRKAVYLDSSNLLVGTNYQVQASSDLINWTNQGSIFAATNSSWRSTNYWNVADWNQLFFRLITSP